MRPDKVTVRLLADGKEVDSAEVSEKSSWAYSFTNLPVYKAGTQGQKVTYTVTEDAVEGYTPKIEAKTDGTGYDITNTHTPDQTSVTVTKAWADENNQDGIRPASVKVQLYADGSASGDPVELNEANKWTYT